MAYAFPMYFPTSSYMLHVDGFLNNFFHLPRLFKIPKCFSHDSFHCPKTCPCFFSMLDASLRISSNLLILSRRASGSHRSLFVGPVFRTFLDCFLDRVWGNFGIHIWGDLQLKRFQIRPNKWSYFWRFVDRFSGCILGLTPPVQQLVQTFIKFSQQRNLT